MTRAQDPTPQPSARSRMPATLKAVGALGEAIRLEDRWITPSAVLKDLELSPRRERRVLIAYVGPPGVAESPADAPWTPEGYLTAAVRLPDLVKDETELDALRARLSEELGKAGLSLVYAGAFPCARLAEHPFFSAMRDLLGETGRSAGDALRIYRQEPEEFLAAWNRDQLAYVRQIVRERAQPLLQAECRALLAPVLRIVCYNTRSGQLQVADFSREETSLPDPVEIVLTEEDLSLLPGPLGEDACNILSQVLEMRLNPERLLRVANHWSVYSPSYGNLHHPYLVAFDDVYKRLHELNKMLRLPVPRPGGSIKAQQYELWERQRIQATRELIASGAFKESELTQRWKQPVRVHGLVLADPNPDPLELEDAGGVIAMVAVDAVSPERESVKFIIETTLDLEGDPIQRALKAHGLTPEFGKPVWTMSRPLGAYLKDKSGGG